MGRAGQTPKSCPCSLALAPAPYLEPPCWSEPCCPPRRAGGTTVSSPRPLWGPSLLCRKSPWEETAGSAPFGRENTLTKAHPSRQRPQIMCVCVGEVGVLGQRPSRLEDLTSTAVPPGGACSSCPSPTAASTGANTSGTGRVGLGEKVDLQQQQQKHWLQVFGAWGFPNARPCTSHLTRVIS